MKRPLLAALLLAAADAAESTFSVSGSGNSFTISRSGKGPNAAETVLFRTVPIYPDDDPAQGPSTTNSIQQGRGDRK